MTGKIVRTYDHIIYYNDSGKYHRVDGPAIEYTDGGKEWWIDGRRHRVDGPAIDYVDGGKEWWVNGFQHREDGPAIEFHNGDKAWYFKGECHRVDGPAIEKKNGIGYWYVNGKNVTNEVNKWRKEMGITDENLTKEESALFVLYFGNVT